MNIRSFGRLKMWANFNIHRNSPGLTDLAVSLVTRLSDSWLQILSASPYPRRKFFQDHCHLFISASKRDPERLGFGRVRSNNNPAGTLQNWGGSIPTYLCSRRIPNESTLHRFWLRREWILNIQAR